MLTADRHLRDERIYKAANQAVDRNRPAPRNELLGFLCECSDTSCKAELELTQAEYLTVRQGKLRFAVAPGHENGLERVLDEFDRFTVVEK